MYRQQSNPCRATVTSWRRGCSLSLGIGSGVQRLASGARTQKPKNPDSKSQTRDPRPKTRRRVRPDFVFRSLRVAVFVDGCFWHGCPKHATWPKNRAAFWRNKIQGNQARDRRVNRALRKRGWTVLRIWEHELRRKAENRLLKRLRSRDLL